MTNKEYHANVSRIGKSGLDLVHRSPYHYWAKYLDPNRVWEEPTPELVIGSAFHSIVLEPHKFGDEYVIAPKFNLRTNQGKEDYAQFIAINEGKTVLTPEQYDTVRRMRDATMKHPLMNDLLLGGIVEDTIHWTDQETGVECKSRPDHRGAGSVLLDLKSTQDASLEGFSRSCAKYRYHVQSAWYLDGCQAAGLRQYDTFVFVAVEKSPPYAVAIYYASDSFVSIGREAYREDLHIYAECIRTGQWPGYPTTIQPLDLPTWATKRL